MQPCCQWKTLSGGPCSCFQVKHVPGVMGVPRGTWHRQICQPFVDDSLYLKCGISGNIAMSGTRAWGIRKLMKLDRFSTHTSGLGIVWRACPCFNQSDSLECAVKYESPAKNWECDAETTQFFGQQRYICSTSKYAESNPLNIHRPDHTLADSRLMFLGNIQQNPAIQLHACWV